MEKQLQSIGQWLRVLDEFGVKEKCFLHTTDNEPTMAAAIEAKIRNGCMAHMESNATQHALKTVETVKNVRHSVKAIATKYNSSNKFKKALKQHQKKLGVQKLGIRQEVATRFTSTYDMFSSFPQAKKGMEVDIAVAEKKYSGYQSSFE